MVLYKAYFSPQLKPISAPLISCPVQTLSISDLGREIKKSKSLRKKKKKKKQKRKKKKEIVKFNISSIMF
jgi:hypothetical protein